MKKKSNILLLLVATAVASLAFLSFGCSRKSERILRNSTQCREVEDWVAKFVEPNLDKSININNKSNQVYGDFHLPKQGLAFAPKFLKYQEAGVFGETIIKDGKVESFVAIGVVFYSPSHNFPDDGLLIKFREDFRHSGYDFGIGNGRVYSFPLNKQVRKTRSNSVGFYYKYEDSGDFIPLGKIYEAGQTKQGGQVVDN